jgi:hypothetical protein
MDPQVGLPALSIAIPQGWTHQFQSTWNKNSDPMVSFSFETQEPAGAGKFYMSPVQQFYDVPQRQGQMLQYLKLMPPGQAFEYMVNLMNQKDPKSRAKGYRIVESQDFPPTEANGGRNSNSAILAEFTENGVQKQELVYVMMRALPVPSGTAWSLSWSGLQDRKGVPQEALGKRYVAISQSVQFFPQWQQRQATVMAQWSNEKKQQSDQNLAQSRQMLKQSEQALHQSSVNLSRQIQATGEATRQANMDRFNRRMESKERVSEMQTDATTGRDNRINPYTGRQFKSDVNVEHVWVSSDGRTIGANDSTYNPNYDSNVSGDWKLAPKGY